MIAEIIKAFVEGLPWLALGMLYIALFSAGIMMATYLLGTATDKLCKLIDEFIKFRRSK